MVHDDRKGTTYNTVVALLRDIISEEEEITPEADLLNNLGMDSLEMVDVGVALEKAFGQTFPIGKVKACVTVDDLVEMVLHATSGEEARTNEYLA